MPTITFHPSGKSVTVPAGTNLLDACHRAGVGIPASCGGKGLCGKCRVRIVKGDVPPHTGYERALSPAEAEAGWRLACLVLVENDLTIDTQDGETVRSVILTDLTGRDADPDGRVRAVPMELPRPTLDDQMCDIGRIMRGLGLDRYPHCALPLLQALPGLLRSFDFRITAITLDNELLGIEPHQDSPRVLGIAFDIGTTTIAGALFDLSSGTPLAVASRTNPQAARGDDVVSRIDHARKGKSGRDEMQALVVKALDEILAETCSTVAVATEQVYFLAACGNTTMHHMLLGLDAEHIAATPFIPAARRGLMIRATHIGLKAGHGARLYALPNISAYVGGDIVAGILAHEVHESDRTVLLIDVGTNGEMALRTGGVTYACSTAAGPAFEGARISCGMRAATGAISSVERDDSDIRIVTVDNAAPRGLCGTGLLDAVAVLLDLGLLDETGCLCDPEDVAGQCPDLPLAIARRLIEDDDGPAFVLAGADDGSPQITLTQRDIREFQLAKGAVAAGAEVMLNAVGKTPDDIDEILLAGGFGNYLRPESALRVGLLPRVPRDQIRFIGNAALAGARLCLLNHDMRQIAERIAEEVRYIELSGRPDFQAAFAEAMEFPE